MFFLFSPITLGNSWLNQIFLFLLLWRTSVAGRRAKLALGNGGGLICHTGIHLSLRHLIFLLLTAAPGASGLLVHRRVWRSSGVWSVWRGGTNTGTAWERTTVYLSDAGAAWCWRCEGNACNRYLVSMMVMDPGQESPSHATGMGCVNTHCQKRSCNCQSSVVSVLT